ncbi:MAG: twin-arginine translocase subunit TatC [Acidimicrobiales bacterium]
MTLFEHLTELRNRLIKSVLAVTLGAVVGFVAYEWIFDILIHPYREICGDADNQLLPGCDLLATTPLEGFSIRLKVAGYTGVAIAMPVLLWQLWRFVTPGLYPHEKKYAVPFVASALALFAAGAGIAYWTMPKALGFLSTIGGENLVNAYSPSSYFQLIVYMLLAFGVGFEFPILLIFLQMAGIVTPTILRRWRRYAIVIIAVAVAIATPSGDPISMMALTIPMWLFYEAAIVVGRIRERRRQTTTAPAPA